MGDWYSGTNLKPAYRSAICSRAFSKIPRRSIPGRTARQICTRL
ncbi:hypothetical protein OESDEN_00839 [Oesophagostomum dentatum]|uniref:Uncharacterized protein n=1 Tax=Oesophagostomum dentatum TaxID=61180 RepID=A0A0B1TTP3_OESDE|nr:hypothetical protein OESDEN_00839 [Oesophagostomum dentatum]